ncbi:Mediator of RNA polymerase II transcription subunit 17 [Entamoeba marina]
MKNQLICKKEEGIARYELNEFNTVEELSVADAERRALIGKNVEDIMEGRYLEMLRKAAAKYPNKEEMKKVIEKEIEQQGNTFDYETVMNKFQIDSHRNEIEMRGRACNELIQSLTNNNLILSTSGFPEKPSEISTEMRIVKIQQILTNSGNKMVKWSLQRLEDVRKVSMVLFQDMKLLSTNWKLTKRSGKFGVMLLDGLTDVIIHLVYAPSLKQLSFDNSSQLSTPFILVHIQQMELGEFKNLNTEKNEDVVKCTTSYHNTDFNLHVFRNNLVENDIFQAFMETDQSLILDRSQYSLSVLLSPNDPFVVRITLQPLVYTFTSQPVEQNLSHFDIFDNISLPGMLMKQIAVVNKVEKNKVKEQTTQTVYEHLIVKRKRVEMNKILHEVAIKHMKENPEQLVIVHFSILIYNKSQFIQNESCNHLFKYDGQITKGNHLVFEKRDLSFLINSEISFIIQRLIKHK